MSISVFLLSLFLKIFFVSIVSLVFTLGPFFLLSTFKNIAITQNVYHSLKPRTTWPKKGYLNLSKSIIKVFLPSSGMCKTALAPGPSALCLYVPNIVSNSKSVRPYLPSISRRNSVLSHNSIPQQNCGSNVGSRLLGWSGSPKKPVSHNNPQTSPPTFSEARPSSFSPQ